MSEERAYGISAALTARSRGLTSYGQLLRIAAATTVSYLLALHLSGSPLPVFAPITTLSVVQASPFSTLASTAQRVLGTALGVAGAAVYLRFVPITWWSIFLALLAALMVARALRLALAGQLQIPIAVVFVLVLGPGDLAVDAWRVADVVLGGLVGVVAVLILPERPEVAPAVAAMDELVTGTAEVLRSVAAELDAPARVLVSPDRHDFVAASRALRDGVNHMRTASEIAAESHRFNLRRPDHQLALEELEAQNAWIWRVVLQTRSLAVTIDWLYDRSGPAPLLAREDAAGLLRVSASLLEVRYRDDPAATAQTEAELRAALDGAVARVGSRGAVSALHSLAVLGRIEQLGQLIVEGPVALTGLEDATADETTTIGSWRERLRRTLSGRRTPA